MPFTTSLFLDCLPDTERAAVLARTKPVFLNQHDLIYDASDRVDHVHFPIDAIVSLVVPLSTGEVIESAMVGRDGIVGGNAALDGRRALNRAVVQVAGKSLRCEPEAIKALSQEYPALRGLLIAHEQTLLAQAQQSAACNVSHVVESRLARWLLRAHDLRGGPDLDLTQEFLADMLGVRRPTVSLVANQLQTAGLLRYRRGRIHLENIEGMNEVACECYATVKSHYDLLLRRGHND